MKPWNDSSIVFIIPDDPTALIAALNNVILPTRLSAIYHKDTKDLEIIFTAQKLADSLTELQGRKFSFLLQGNEYICEFTNSTERLMVIAENAAYPQNSDTSFRNLRSFSDYTRRPTGLGEREKRIRDYFGKPTSFFIRNIEWDEEEVLETLRHISFYLRYYDALSPFVLIHPPVDETIVNPQARYIHGAFPATINSQSLHPTLLSFWTAGADQEADLKFLQYYRIIEFVTSFYLASEKMTAVRRVLATPDLASRLGPAVDTLVALIREDKPDPYTRFTKVVTDLVDKELIWREICANGWAFTEKVVFDGGYAQDALVSSVANFDCFGPQGLTAMARAFRGIRNALAHGGEAQSGEVILPTAANLKRLQPWVHLITVAAGQVVLYEHTT